MQGGCVFVRSECVSQEWLEYSICCLGDYFLEIEVRHICHLSLSLGELLGLSDDVRFLIDGSITGVGVVYNFWIFFENLNRYKLNFGGV